MALTRAGVTKGNKKLGPEETCAPLTPRRPEQVVLDFTSDADALAQAAVRGIWTYLLPEPLPRSTSTEKRR